MSYLDWLPVVLFIAVIGVTLIAAGLVIRDRN